MVSSLESSLMCDDFFLGGHSQLVADLLFESMIYSSSEVDKCAEDVHLACSVLFDLSMLLFRIAQLDLSFLGRR